MGFSAPVFHSTSGSDDAQILDVEPLHSSMLADDAMPLVLPPVAGHIPEFHPDFGVQACPPSSDLEDRLTRAMLRDADIVPLTTTLEKSRTALTQGLIIDIRKREIFEWKLTRITASNGETRQELSRRSIFSHHTPAPDYAECCTLVSKELRRIVSNDARNTALWELRSAVENVFNVF
jgi:hypothetical protein